MKYFILLSLLFCITMTARPQKDSSCQALIKKRYGSTYIQLPETRKKYTSPAIFNDIQVADCRRDTSRLGLATRGIFKGQILFHTTAADAMTAYFRQHFVNPKGSLFLLVVIKDLWLFDDEDSTIIESFKREVFTKPRGNIALRCEAYLRIGERYMPLTYLDTLVSSTTHTAVGMGESKLSELLFLFMNKVVGIDFDAVSKRRRIISYNAIDSFSRSRYNYPMDTVTAPQKGVYASVDEFLNNRPSIADYEIVKNRNTEMELHIRDEEGKLYYTHKMWGFSDGTHCFVMMDGTLFPILPVQHTFYVLGSKEYKALRAPAPLFIPFPGGFLYGYTAVSETIIKKLNLFRLDVQSGEVIR